MSTYEMPRHSALDRLRELGPPNSPTPLFKGTYPIDFPQAGITLDAGVEGIFDRRAPKLRVRISSPPSALAGALSRATVTIDGTQVQCLVANFEGTTHVDGRRELSAVLLPVDTNDFGSGEVLSRITFAVVNFDEYLGDPISNQGGSWCGRLVLVAKGWRVTLDQRQDLRDMFAILKAEGGFAHTHAGSLEHSDGSPFSVRDAQIVLDVLYFLLSFARGHDVSLVLHRGEDALGSKKWWRWLNANVDAWCNPPTWFDKQRPEQLDAMFKELLEGWSDEAWRKAMWLAVHWYRLAQQNSSTDEAAIVLSFTGLDLLSWFRLVEVDAQFTATLFDGLPANQRLRLFLEGIGVTTGIPSDLPDLAAHATREQWRDGPACLAALRNAAVHPRRRGKVFDAPDRVRWDASKLALWYLELGLLSMLGHNGTYINRVARRTGHGLELVPWAQAPDST